MLRSVSPVAMAAILTILAAAFLAVWHLAGIGGRKSIAEPPRTRLPQSPGTGAPSSAATTPATPAASSVTTTPRRPTTNGYGCTAEDRRLPPVVEAPRPSGIAEPTIAPIAAGPGAVQERPHVAGSRAAGRSGRAPSRTNANDGAKATSAASRPPPTPGRRVADDGDGLHHRTGRDLAERDRVQELAVGHPVVVVDRVGLHQRDDHEAAAVRERADLERHPGERAEPAGRHRSQRPGPERDGRRAAQP